MTRSILNRIFGKTPQVLLLVAMVTLSFGGALPVQAQTAGNLPGNSLGNKSDSEFWRAIRKGQGGVVSNPNLQWEKLIAGEVFACSQDKNCTEKGVGFSLPVHSTMPPISVDQGVGVGMPILLLLGGFLVAGLAWATWVMVRLGKDEAA